MKLLLVLCLYDPRLDAQTTPLWTLDLNRDSLVDVSLSQDSVEECGPWGWNGKYVCVQWHRQSLLARGAGALLDCSQALRRNDEVSLHPTPGATWKSALTLYHDGYHGWGPVFTNLPYVGLRLVAPDGPHLAWIRMDAAWRVSDFGWQPQPGEPIRVGDKPALPPPADGESFSLISADLDGGEIDCVLRVRWWTNLVSGASGLSAVLTNRTGLEVLSVPGFVEGTPVWFPWPVPEGGVIPTNPVKVASWRTPAAGVVLLEERRDAQGALSLRTGPLANRTDLVVAVRRADRPDILTGWLRFSCDFKLLGQGLCAAGCAVGEPPPQPNEIGRTRWDLDGDERIEYVSISYQVRQYQPLGGYVSVTEWTTLVPLGQARILGGAGLSANALIALEPAQPLRWLTNGVRLRLLSDTVPPVYPPETDAFDGYLGLRYETASGVHLAWLRPADNSYAFEPRPGRALPAGLVPKYLWAAIEEGEVVVSWNRTLSNHVLEATAGLPGGDWQAVTVPVRGRVALPLAEAARYFRLALPGAKPGLLRVLQELPGRVHAVAFRGDADHLIVVDDGGPRLWRADGTVEAPVTVQPADFVMHGAALSPDNAYAFCFGSRRRTGSGYGPEEDGHAVHIRLADMAVQRIQCWVGGEVAPHRWGAVASLGQRVLLAQAAGVALAEYRGEGFQCMRTLPGKGPVAFTDGRLLLAGSTDGTARVWRVDTGALVRTFEGHSGEVTAVAVSPDNRRVATGTADGLVLLWDVSDVVGP